METLLDIASFAGKAALIVIAVGLILALIANFAMRSRPARQHLEIDDLNERFQAYADSLQEMTLDPKQLKADRKAREKAEKQKSKEANPRPRVFVLDFDGDIRASAVDHFRDEITAILTIATATDEIVVRVESTGGMVHTYGLAAAQLLRIREKGIKLTVCVDKVAASGGYMMACTANQLLAAPFAILGSIGVVAQVPNFNRVLKKHDVDYEEMTAGEYKRTVSVLGEITPKGRQKFLEQLEETHQLFKDFVTENRPQLNLEQVATGEYWYGRRALQLGLCDKLMSSDDYLYAFHPNAQILKVRIEERKSFGEKIAENFSLTVEKSLRTWWQGIHDQNIFRS